MIHTIPIPARREIRIAVDGCVARWARSQGLDPGAVHRTVHRYGGQQLDMSRVWGAQTRHILRALIAAVEAADIPQPPSRDAA